MSGVHDSQDHRYIAAALSAAFVADAFSTVRATYAEVSLKDLSPEDRDKFDVSMKKERGSWMKFGAVGVLTGASSSFAR